VVVVILAVIMKAKLHKRLKQQDKRLHLPRRLLLFLLLQNQFLLRVEVVAVLLNQFMLIGENRQLNNRL
jgi:hypothetical protein